MSDPTVLFVHGLGSTHQQNWVANGWVDILASEGLRAVGAELPGHGATPPDADAVEAVLAAIEPTTTTSAVGFSAGAATLLAAAISSPERFDRIVLMGIGDGVLGSHGPDADDLVAALRGHAEPEDVWGRLFWRLTESAGNDRAAVATFLQSGRPTIDAGALSRVTCPVLVVLGDRDDAGPGDALVAALPDARGVRLRGVDHFATTSDIGAIDATIRFLTD